MSNYEYHKGKLKKVDLSEYDNNREKYFEARCRYEFSGLSEEELLATYKDFNESKYKNRGGWEDYWMSESYIRDVINVGDDIYEVVDTELDDNDTQCTITEVGENEYVYYTSFYNGGTWLNEMLEDGMKEYLNKNV